jgi:hypothetical protein
MRPVVRGAWSTALPDMCALSWWRSQQEFENKIVVKCMCAGCRGWNRRVFVDSACKEVAVDCVRHLTATPARLLVVTPSAISCVVLLGDHGHACVFDSRCVSCVRSLA